MGSSIHLKRVSSFYQNLLRLFFMKRLKTEQEHLFRNIQRNEYHNLFDFICGKGLKIMNLGDVQTADGVARVLQDEDDDAVDPHLERIKNLAGGDESDEECIFHLFNSVNIHKGEEMDEKNDVDKVDDVILPGFRFHPTDEELVGFYLKRKVQQRALPIELIKQVDIYKYDPWDLPKLAASGEKEWHFYCPRDRKYRNSARPNRVTGAGFWKATGTDQPIYSSDSTKCIGLKKSLVFYRGRAAKGIKTDWMMHEFRLPSLTESAPPKKLLDKNIPANDSWAICRIFKKTNSMAQRAFSHSWVSPLPETLVSDMFTQGTNCTQFSSENISCTTEIGSAIQFCSTNDLQQAPTSSFSAFDIPSYKPINPTVYKPSLFPASNGDLQNGFMFSPLEMSGPMKCAVDTASMLLNPALIGDVINASRTSDFEGPPQQFSGFSISLPQEMQENLGTGEDVSGLRKNQGTALNNQWETIQSVGFPFNLPSNDAWRPNLPWDSPPCPSEMSTNYSTNKCYT